MKYVVKITLFSLDKSVSVVVTTTYILEQPWLSISFNFSAHYLYMLYTTNTTKAKTSHNQYIPWLNVSFF